jgi:uncharacterized protein (UPF0262 family)
MSDSPQRINTITLDDASIVRRAMEVEHERRIAMVDILHNNQLELIGELGTTVAGPYDLFLSVRDNRLTLRFTGSNTITRDVTLPLMPFRGIIKDYFLMCESYYDAIKSASSDKIQTIDMARRGVHNEGSELLQSMLGPSLTMDFSTARRLFTLISVLHVK